jgi:benzoyl-CoA reductase/2-hydroxyglutaryl-CoA dehydratase subunit BcrC/BadD/HgdB
MPDSTGSIGFACAYTPLPVIHAAGFPPHRLLPMGEPPDRSGTLLHENLCPHARRLLDRALAGDLPELAGMVFVNSCDAMRRLAAAWRRARPGDRTVTLELPVAADEASIAFFAGELRRLAAGLTAWGGRAVDDPGLEDAVARYRSLALGFERLRERLAAGTLAGGASRLQRLYNLASATPVDRATEALDAALAEPGPGPGVDRRPAVFVFGNVLPDPAAFELVDAGGLRVAAEDLCTGSRLFPFPVPGDSGDPFQRLARALLDRPGCGRTLEPARPGRLGEDLVAQARKAGVRAAIGHTMKFCDPYLARLPAVREAFRTAGIPLLLLEGDGTLHSLGQHRTRLAAFAEMLG